MFSYLKEIKNQHQPDYHGHNINEKKFKRKLSYNSQAHLNNYIIKDLTTSSIYVYKPMVAPIQQFKIVSSIDNKKEKLYSIYSNEKRILFNLHFYNKKYAILTDTYQLPLGKIQNKSFFRRKSFKVMLAIPELTFCNLRIQILPTLFKRNTPFKLCIKNLDDKQEMIYYWTYKQNQWNLICSKQPEFILASYDFSVDNTVNFYYSLPNELTTLFLFSSSFLLFRKK
ncbi:hypothetical protein K502DRAFT_365372 [Neoconidiobolus thromboides FSU 785]|nr:hypothetical protein K502DRAFT_365372 [Neoconidiobolus thromboides FSU 785]